MKALDTYSKEKLIKIVMEVMKENAFLSQEYARLKDIMNMSTEQDYKILTIAEYLLLIQGVDVTQKPLSCFEDDTFINSRWQKNNLVCYNYHVQHGSNIIDDDKIKSIQIVDEAIERMLENGANS